MGFFRLFNGNNKFYILLWTQELQIYNCTGFPLRLENGKAFSSQGKVREFPTDWKSQGKSYKILEKSGNFRQMIFIISVLFAKMNQVFSWKKKQQNIQKILDKWKIILEESMNFASPEKWEPCGKFSSCQNFPESFVLSRWREQTIGTLWADALYRSATFS